MDATGATDLGRNEASVDNEALIESSFRRLLAAVETYVYSNSKLERIFSNF